MGRLERLPLVARGKVERVAPAKLIEVSCEVIEVVHHGRVVGLAGLHAPTLLLIIQRAVIAECSVDILALLRLLLAGDGRDAAEVALHGARLHGSHGAWWWSLLVL